MPTVNLTSTMVASAAPQGSARLELWDEKTPGLCLRVTDKGARSWVLRYRTPDGRQPRLKLGDAKRMSLKDARLEAWRLKGEIEKGADPQGAKRQARETARSLMVRTFDDLLSAYWTACETGEWKPKKKRKRPQTLAFEKRLAARHVSPALGSIPLVDIKKATVRDLLRDMIAKGIGAQTNRCHAIVRQAFNFGLAEDLVASNPAMGFESFHDAKPRRRVWKDEELRRLWAALEHPSGLKDGDGNRVYLARSTAIALQLCALLLQRRGEVAGMSPSELDLAAKVWTVPAERMKGGRAHQVPLPPKAVALIEEALELARDPQRESPEVVFPSPRDRTKSIRADALTHALDKVRDCIGVDGASVHDLRRTGSTALTSERIGVSPFIRSKVLGHETDTGGGAAVSSTHYDLNEYMAEKRRALEAWETELNRITATD
ncbi:MAG: integrase arm-type DNA-binding domain-containing protein [Caulobacteraceae bacterium]|nr:integrase arm-type DNA-binding domain-containing protein [Caulobacteraceae bacterium]